MVYGLATAILSYIIANNDFVLSPAVMDNAALLNIVANQQQAISNNISQKTIQLADGLAKQRASALGRYLLTKGYWSLFAPGICKLVRTDADVMLRKGELVAFHGTFGFGLFETSTMIVTQVVYSNDLNFSYTFQTTQRSMVDGSYTFSFETSGDSLTMCYHKTARANDDIVSVVRNSMLNKPALDINNTNSCRRFCGLCSAYITDESREYTYMLYNGPAVAESPVLIQNDVNHQMSPESFGSLGHT